MEEKIIKSDYRKTKDICLEKTKTTISQVKTNNKLGKTQEKEIEKEQNSQ